MFEVNDVTVEFQIKDSETRKRLLRRGMWNIANVPMILSKWSPVEEEEEEEEIKVIPMWITMKMLPIRCSHGMVWDLSPVQWANRKGYILIWFCVRVSLVFVEADMTKELPKAH